MSTEMDGSTENTELDVLNDALRGRFGETVAATVAPNGDIRLEASANDLPALSTFLRDDPSLRFDYPADLTAWDSGEEFVVWYRLHSMERNRNLIVRVRLERIAPEVPSVTEVWPGMNWHERECFDLYGIRFKGHPDSHDDTLMRILLPEDWEGHPFRRDYEPFFSGNPLHGPQERN